MKNLPVEEKCKCCKAMKDEIYTELVKLADKNYGIVKMTDIAKLLLIDMA